MGLFGPSRKEKFAQNNARGLAEYLKNNAVTLGGEAYAKCQAVGIFPPEIDKALLWYFWSTVFAFRVAQDTLALKRINDDKTSRSLFEEFIEIDNKYLRPIEHAPYAETFGSVNAALDLVKAYDGKSAYEQAAAYMLHAVKTIDGLSDQDQRYTVVQALTDAATSFPPLVTVIEQSA